MGTLGDTPSVPNQTSHIRPMLQDDTRLEADTAGQDMGGGLFLLGKSTTAGQDARTCALSTALVRLCDRRELGCTTYLEILASCPKDLQGSYHSRPQDPQDSLGLSAGILVVF